MFYYEYNIIALNNCIPTVVIHLATVQSEETHNSSEDKMAGTSEKGSQRYVYDHYL